jgi:heme A synthase
MANRNFVRFAWVTTWYTVAVALWGAIVRATGSGAGCGESWPLCNGKLVFGSPPFAKFIELAHRSSTGIDGVLIAIMVFWAFRAFKPGHPVRAGATLTVVFVIIESLIGAALVKYGLVVNDASPARAFVLSLHLANTLALIASPALTAWWASGHSRLRWGAREWLSLAGVVIVGITGAMSALADTLFPSPTLQAGLAQDWSASANFLVRLRALHPLLALTAGIWLAYYASSRITKAHTQSVRVMVLVAIQIVAGVVNLALLGPLGMQVVHLALADALWISLLVLCESPA